MTLNELADRRKIEALMKLLAEEPPYPPGSMVRQMQDELAALRSRSQMEERGR